MRNGQSFFVKSNPVDTGAIQVWGLQMKEQEPILIMGTGAMAGLFGARLAAAGKKVVMLGSWPESLTAIQEQGIRLVDAEGRESSYPVTATQRSAEAGLVRYALVLVKSWQTALAAEQLPACLEPNGLAVTLQNGAGNRDILVQALGSARVRFGVTTAGANLLAPGRVQAAGAGVIFLEEHPRLDPLADVLRQAGFVVASSPDVEALLWGKLVINAAINPLTALLNISNGKLLEIQPARDLVFRIACEAAAVALALGIQLPYSDPRLALEAVARQTAANRSSMLQDLQRGAPTEIDAICGAIVRAGEKTGVPTPLNRTLWQLIRARVEATSTTEARTI